MLEGRTNTKKSRLVGLSTQFDILPPPVLTAPSLGLRKWKKHGDVMLLYGVEFKRKALEIIRKNVTVFCSCLFSVTDIWRLALFIVTRNVK